MTPRTKASLRHAARLLNMQIRFYPAYRCFTAVAARPCTILDIALTHTAIFNQHRLHVVKTALHQVQHQFKSNLQSLPQQQLDHLTANAAVVPPSTHSELGEVTADSYTVSGEVRKNAGDAFFTEDGMCFHRFAFVHHCALVMYSFTDPTRP